MRKTMIVVSLLLCCAAAHAQFKVFMCKDANNVSYYANTGETGNCKPVSLAGLTKSDWENIYEDNNIGVYIYRKDIIQVGKYKKAWVMWNYAIEQTPTKYPYVAYRSTKNLEYFSCAEEATATVQSIFYSSESGTGENVASFKYVFGPSLFTEAVPDSFGAMLLKHICGKPERPHRSTADEMKADRLSSNSNGTARLSVSELKARANGKLPKELSPDQIKKLGY